MAQLVPPIAQFVNRFVGTQAFVLQDTTIIVDIAPSAITIKGKSKANHRGTVIFRLRGSSLVTSS